MWAVSVVQLQDCSFKGGKGFKGKDGFMPETMQAVSQLKTHTRLKLDGLFRAGLDS